MWRTLWVGGTRLSCCREVLAYACKSEELSAALDQSMTEQGLRPRPGGGAGGEVARMVEGTSLRVSDGPTKELAYESGYFG